MRAQKRTPKQERSKLRKDKILSVAYDLFSQKGYYNVTTNMIAQVANVPISSLYSYFNDKDEILFELLDLYNDSFLSEFDFTKISNETFTDKSNIDVFIRNILTKLIEVHLQSKDFNKELQSLYYHIPKVAIMMDNHERKLKETCMAILCSIKNMLTITDFETASTLCVNIISLTVDCIVFNKNSTSSDKLINESINAITKYLTC